MRIHKRVPAVEMSPGPVLCAVSERGLQSLRGLQLTLQFSGTLLKLALHFGGALTDIHGLAHCNERGWARADIGRADNGDNLGCRDVHRGAMWPGERDEKIQDRWEN